MRVNVGRCVWVGAAVFLWVLFSARVETKAGVSVARIRLGEGIWWQAIGDEFFDRTARLAINNEYLYVATNWEVRKFSMDGTHEWTTTNAPQSAENCCLVVESNGQGYVGYNDLTWEFETRPVVVHFLSDGNDDQYYPLTEDGGQVFDVAISPEGWAYAVGGTAQTTDDDGVMVVGRFGADLWPYDVVTYEAVGHERTHGAEVEVDPDGNVYVAGVGESAGKRLSWVLVKYSPTLEEIWRREFPDEKNPELGRPKIMVDDEGEIVMGGITLIAPEPAGLFWLARITATGDTAWMISELRDVEIKDFVITPDDNVVTTSLERYGLGVAHIEKYDSTGALAWETVCGGGDVTRRLHHASGDGAGVTYLLGENEDTVVVTAMDPDGEEIWTAAAPDTGLKGLDLVVEYNGNAYVAIRHLSKSQPEGSSPKTQMAGWIDLTGACDDAPGPADDDDDDDNDNDQGSDDDNDESGGGC